MEKKKRAVEVVLSKVVLSDTVYCLAGTKLHSIHISFLSSGDDIGTHRSDSDEVDRVLVWNLGLFDVFFVAIFNAHVTQWFCLVDLTNLDQFDGEKVIFFGDMYTKTKISILTKHSLKLSNMVLECPKWS